jgi:hypothetical protein
MGFLAPAFLLGLGLLALPVWLHLLKRHKSTPQHFSSLMFFERSLSSSVRQRRLDFLLLLALRLALLALVVAAFARPFLRGGTAAGPARRLLVIALDESASMGAGRRMEMAREQALDVLGHRAPADPAQVLGFGSRVRLLTGATTDAGLLRSAVVGVRAGGARSSLGDLAAALRNLARTASAPLEVHLFSDLQRSSMPPNFQDLRLSAGTKLVLHRVASADEANWTVESVDAPKRVVEPKQARVEAVIAGFHTPEARKSVALLVNGRVGSRQDVTVPASGRARVAFTGLDVPYGFSRCGVAVEGSDALEADDQALFAVERADAEKILYVSGPGSMAGLLYVRTALDAATHGLFTLEPRDASSMGPLMGTPPAAILLADPGMLPAAAEKSIVEYVRAGGGVLVTVGTDTAARGRVPVASLTVRGSRYEPRGGERFLNVAEVDSSHPVLEKAGRWDDVRFYQAFDVDAGGTRVLAKLNDGTPLLLEKRLGEGRVLVLTSPLDNRSSDLLIEPVFLPWIEAAMRWLGGVGEHATGALVDASIDLRRSSSGGMSVEVIRPDGERALSFSRSAQAVSVALDQPGFWEIRRPAGRADLLAVNIDRRESDLAVMPAESAELWQGAPGAAAPVSGAAGGATPALTSLWGWVLAAAIAAGLGEAWVAGRHWSREG